MATSESGQFASLSPRLLARKGGAKPAMRPQVQPLSEYQVDIVSQPQDDLGWNDMGEDAGASVSTEALTVEAKPAEVVAINGGNAAIQPATPEIVTRQKALAARLDWQPGKKHAGLGQRRAAFTLRIEPDRHLQLRLASTVTGRSAQSLLTEALDRMLDEMPEIRSLAENVRNRS